MTPNNLGDLMKLLESTAKELLKKAGIRVPPGIITTNSSYSHLSYYKEKYRDFFMDQKEVIIKAQVLDGKRQKNDLIKSTDNYKESLTLIDNLYKREWKGKRINKLLIEKKLNIKEEYFIAFLYDTITRKSMAILSKKGGIDIEDNKNSVATINISILNGLLPFQARQAAKEAGFTGAEAIKISSILIKAYNCFQEYDCRTLEINPLVKTEDGLFFAVDAKIVIDDSALSRQGDLHEVFFKSSEEFNERESKARAIDLYDHRGVAGKTYIDMDGDIAVLASGGGASLICMDSLIQAGGSPANYTEYSGNPSRDKVKQLTKLTLDKPNLSGCLVIGGRANFTDLFETLAGFADGLKETSPLPKYPIVIRRAGPRADEAFDFLEQFKQQYDLDITLCDESVPLTEAVKLLVQKSKTYKNGNNIPAI